MVINWFAIAETEIYDLFIGNIEGDILEVDSGDVTELFLGGDFVAFEDKGGDVDIGVKADSRLEHNLLRIISSSIVVKSEAFFYFNLKDIKYKFP